MNNTRSGPVAARARDDESRFDLTLRPKTLDEYVGQAEHKENLKVFVEAARPSRRTSRSHLAAWTSRSRPKTTLAYILANELGVELHSTSGPAVEHKGALAGLLTKLNEPTFSSSTKSIACNRSSKRISIRH